MAKRRPQSTANDTGPSEAAPKTKAPKTAAPRRSIAMATASEPAGPAQPTEDEIRHRAYLRYLDRGSDDGGAFDDWLYAERELKKT